MGDTKTIAARLREWVIDGPLRRSYGVQVLCNEAADALASHEARIAELEGALRSFMAASYEPDPESKSPRDVLLANAWAKARAAISKSEGKL